MKTTNTQNDITGSYRTPDGKAQIDFGITYRNGYPEFTATGHYDGSCGQCIDRIAEAYPEDKQVQLWHRRWKLHHLKDATMIQSLVEAEARKHPARDFFQDQASQFLTDNGLKFRATLSDTKTPTWDRYTPKKKCPNCKGGGRKLQGFPLGHHQTVWEANHRPPLNMPIWATCLECSGSGEVEDTEARKHGHHYRVTISRKGERLTFDFWGSIRDAEEGKHPTAYDVLACISGDAYTPDTFKDFCGEYGYEEDSIKALQTFRRCSAFSRRLKAFFTPAELEQLSEIQ